MIPLPRKIWLGGLVALAIGALWWLIPSEEERIQQVLEQARASVSSEGKPADGLALLARVSQLTQCLTRDVEIQVDVFGGLSGNLNGVDEVRAAAAHCYRRAGRAPSQARAARPSSPCRRLDFGTPASRYSIWSASTRRPFR